MAVDLRNLSLVLSYLAVLFLAGCGCDKRKSAEEKVERARQEITLGAASFVGRAACEQCHDEHMKSYAWSLHDRTLSEPSGQVLAAPFGGESVKGKHVAATFTRKDGRPVIESGGTLPVKYTIGVDPIQQYVVEVGAGDLRIFGAAFDNRSRAENGKKWFVSPGNDVPPGDEAHYLERTRDYETRCASCHSTNVNVTYDWQKDVGRAKFSEIDVSCEACHGPASRHVEMAQKYSDAWPPHVENFGFDLPLAPFELRRWTIPPDAKVAQLLGEGDAPPERTEELASCGACHSHRIDLETKEAHREKYPYADRYLVSLLSSELYFADGQAKEQAYVYGSFLQSKHAMAGVICSDCHNPHSTELRLPVVDLCTSCHAAGTYETEAHQMHPPGITPSPLCVDCHMPERVSSDGTARREHGFALPRPDLTESTGAPLSCDSCHQNKTPIWAKRRIEKFFGAERPESFAPAFAASDARDPGAPELLEKVVKNESFAPIVRASALVRWAACARPMKSLDQAVRSAAQADDPILRRAAAEASAYLAPELHHEVIGPLFTDSVGSVRFSAVASHVLKPAPPKPFQGFTEALNEAKQVVANNAFSAPMLLLLSRLLEREGDAKGATAALQATMERFPWYSPAAEHFARQLLAQKKDEDAQRFIVDALKTHPQSALLNHERGRALLKQEKTREALPFLQASFENATPSQLLDHGYAYAVTLQALGDWAEALAVLRIVKKAFPESKKVLDAIELFEKRRSK